MLPTPRVRRFSPRPAPVQPRLSSFHRSLLDRNHAAFELHEAIPPHETLPDWLALAHIEGLGPVRLQILLDRFGTPDRIFRASRTELVPLRLGQSVLDRLLDGPDHLWAQEQMRLAAESGTTILTLDHPAYPDSLRRIPQPPPILYVRGSTTLQQPRCIAVVGTRDPTGVGAEACTSLVRDWASAGCCIVSGLARGIDEIAHRTALRSSSPTIAVLGCALDQLETSARRNLAGEIAAHGLLVSEFPFLEPVRKGNFPRRNRIIAGLSQAVVVAEAGITSGALITARYALEQGLEVLACPGPAAWPSFEGCHRLLREGAALCARSRDLDDQLGWSTPVCSAPAKDGLLNLLTGPGATPEEIAVRMGQSIRDIQVLLVLRELAGEVFRGVDGRWRTQA